VIDDDHVGALSQPASLIKEAIHRAARVGITDWVLGREVLKNGALDRRGHEQLICITGQRIGQPYQQLGRQARLVGCARAVAAQLSEASSSRSIGIPEESRRAGLGMVINMIRGKHEIKQFAAVINYQM
jgi:hypothetical protein